MNKIIGLIINYIENKASDEECVMIRKALLAKLGEVEHLNITLENELIFLIKKGLIITALQRYMEFTGSTRSESENYIARLRASISYELDVKNI